jgi:hypothetical protein
VGLLKNAKTASASVMFAKEKQSSLQQAGSSF